MPVRFAKTSKLTAKYWLCDGISEFSEGESTSCSLKHERFAATSRPLGHAREALKWTASLLRAPRPSHSVAPITVLG